jgi:hypothetical protein
VCAGVNLQEDEVQKGQRFYNADETKGTGLARGRAEGRDLRDLENLLSQKAKKAQEKQCLCAQSDSCKECRSRGNLSRFQSLKESSGETASQEHRRVLQSPIELVGVTKAEAF